MTTDLALPSLTRLRSFLHSIGRYSPSPFLVGHYGGAGDLIGGFSRCVIVLLPSLTVLLSDF